MKDQSEHDCRGRWTLDRLTGELEASQTVGHKFTCENVAHRSRSRLGSDKQIMSGAQRGDPRVDDFEDLPVVAERLTQNRLDVCQNVSDPVSEFVIEQLSHALF